MVLYYSKPPSQRQLKVGELLRSEIAMLLLQGNFHMPIVKDVMITISYVKVSPDLRNATIFVTIQDLKTGFAELKISGETKKDVLNSLKEITPEIRRSITPKLGLRYSPELRFVFDKSLETENVVAKLLDDITIE